MGGIGASGDAGHRPAQGAYLREEGGEHSVSGSVVDAERDLVPVGVHEDELDERGQQRNDDEVQGSARKGEPPQASAAGHADRCSFPDGGGRR